MEWMTIKQVPKIMCIKYIIKKEYLFLILDYLKNNILSKCIQKPYFILSNTRKLMSPNPLVTAVTHRLGTNSFKTKLHIINEEIKI